jgi:hypothetical protein
MHAAGVKPNAGIPGHHGHWAGGIGGFGRRYDGDQLGCKGIDGTGDRRRRGFFGGKQEGDQEDYQAQNDEPQAGAQRVSVGAGLAAPYSEVQAGVDRHPIAGLEALGASDDRLGIRENFRDDGLEIPVGHGRFPVQEARGNAPGLECVFLVGFTEVPES